MKLEQVEPIAVKWVEWLTPYCERVEIAGGVRRRKAEPHDIEIVCIPKIHIVADMFGNPFGKKSELEEALRNLLDRGCFRPVKYGEKYKQLALPEGINIDLFIVRPETWAVQFVIRTGSADFSHRCVTPRKHGGLLPSNYKVKDGQVWNGSKAFELTEEIEFLDLLGVGWIDPSERKA